jgi:hypothetical protein
VTESSPVSATFACSGSSHSQHTISCLSLLSYRDCSQPDPHFVFYYESRKRELQTRFIYEDRCDERLKARVKLRNLHASHTLGCAIPAVIHT